mmetsp:Transcript_26461/g.63871  ORF Transcript_26461/g.63871 Transcript_26461/m.63871 type:complete len:309 (-) Transcript_26461:278-1204(-)
MGNVRDVQAPRGDVGCDQVFDLAFLESFENAISMFLTAIPVDCISVQTIPTNTVHNLIHQPFCVCKYQRLLHLRVLQIFSQLIKLRANPRTFNKLLRDKISRGSNRANLDERVLGKTTFLRFQELRDDFQELSRESGRKHQRLSDILARHVKPRDFDQVLLEPIFHHSIGFVENEGLDVLQSDSFIVEKVFQAPWGSTENLAAFFESQALLHPGSATVHHLNPKASAITELLRFIVNLSTKLPRWCHNKNVRVDGRKFGTTLVLTILRRPRKSPVSSKIQASLQGREQECSGFPGTSLGTPKDIMALQ